MKRTGLRRPAETLLRTTKREVAAMPVPDVQRLVHELQVHQIELEMQNEELRRAQVELEAARDRYADLYDAAPTGYLTLNSKGIILEANLPACAVLGMNRKSLLGKSLVQFVAPKDQPTLVRHSRELFTAGTKQTCEAGLAAQSGLTVRFESVVVLDEAGQLSRQLTTLLDVTERTRAAAAFQDWQQKLEWQRTLEARERIGHDLHDGILQSLYAIGLSLERCKLDLSKAPAKTTALLTQSIGQLRVAMQEVRTFIGGLETEGLMGSDLPMSLRTMAETLAQFHGSPVQVSVDYGVAAGLSPAQSLEVLKLAKEALSNSLRHAQATEVRVSLLRRNGQVCLVVRDNGVGYDRSDVSGTGYGLASMAARARNIGATLSVRSAPQQGTCVALNLSTQTGQQDRAGQGDCPLRVDLKSTAKGSRRSAGSKGDVVSLPDGLRSCPFCRSPSLCIIGDESSNRTD
ncbi:MAG: histidine kinase [Nitrospirae bacterium]|nr:histidine kinase [Nitrospirota bacterium]